MPTGLQVWDESGNLRVDITSRLARFIGSVPIKGDAGQVFNAELQNGDAFWSFQQDFVFNFVNGDVSRPVFNYANGVISWSYTAGFSANNKKMTGWLFYGVR
jgi:hypothetical protein